MPAVQQAYVYLVLAIAIHMVVLGVANLLRVGAEVALAAPSGGFTGLPFVFADALVRPRDLQREQLSLALALLAIGAPAWLVHWRIARRGIARDPSERASPLRSFYLNLVVLVTALLAFGYSANALNRALHEALGPFRFAPTADPYLAARLAGALAMALTAVVACVAHVRIGHADRAALFIGGQAAVVRRLRSYGLVAIGLLFLLVNAADAIAVAWTWAWGGAVGFQPYPEPSFPPGRGPPPGEVFRPDQVMELRRRLASSLPLVASALPLWLVSWRAAQRTSSAPSREGEEERRSAVRKGALYLLTTVSALGMLGALAAALSRVLREALFTAEHSERPLWEDVASPLSFAVAFGASWLFHRLAVEREAALEAEQSAQGAVRRIYYYLVAAVSLALLAVGAAGALGVMGSYVVGQQTHTGGEQSTYLALVIVGLPAWAFHWARIQRRIWSDDVARAAEERAAPQRRAYLYLAVFGGVVTVLVAGSAALYTILNGFLAQHFDTTLLHDVWHLVVDAGVGAAALLWHARILRADRAALAPPAEAARPRALVAIVRGDMTRERLVAALGASDVTVYEADEAAVAEVARRLGAS